MDSTEEPPIVSLPTVARAIVAGHIGSVIREARRARDLTQLDLAKAIGCDRSGVSRMESRPDGAPVATLRQVAKALDVPPTILGITGPSGARDAAQEANMKRSEMLRGMLGIAAALAFPAVLTAEAPRRLDAQDVRDCRRLLEKIDTVDTQGNSDAVHELSADVMRRLQHAARHATYSPEVGDELNAVLAFGHETAGWIAFDTGRYDTARSHWLEALHLAELHDLHSTRVTVMADMALLANHLGWGGDTIRLTQAAARTPAVTPRVASLLAAREGIGHALQRNPADANTAFVRSARLLDKGRHPHDPAWIDFWGPDDFACHQTKAAMLLGDVANAERAARVALAGARRGPYARNVALYGVRLGSVLVHRRSLDEAIATLRPLAATPIGSGRVRAELRQAVASMAKHRDYRPAREFAVWADRMVGAA